MVSNCDESILRLDDLGGRDSQIKDEIEIPQPRVGESLLSVEQVSEPGEKILEQS